MGKQCIPVFWVLSDFADESEGERCSSQEGSDFAAERGYEEGDPNTEEGHEEGWGEVQEALSTMGHEDYDETVLCHWIETQNTSRGRGLWRASHDGRLTVLCCALTNPGSQLLLCPARAIARSSTPCLD
jgi:hypothetical protein